MRSLSELNVVNIAGRGEMLLPNHVLGELEHDRAEPDNKLRRANDCVIDQLIYEQKSSREQEVAENKKDISEIKKNIDAARLLAHLSQTHGEIPGKYTITQGKDGSDRIQCGTHNWNASDFLTKERHLPWGEAEVVLRAVYASQLKEEVPQRRHTPRKELWNKYRNEWKPRERARSAAAWITQKDSQKKRRATLKAEYRDEKSRLYASSLGKLERKTALSLALINKVMDETVLREQIRNERLVLKSLYQKSAATQYREFLAEQAQKGDELALAELRRQSPAPHQAEDGTPEIRSGDSDSLAATDDAAAPLLKRDLRYSVSGNGNVTYHDEYGIALFQDCWRAVRLYQDDAKTIETGLRLAQQKFGSKLSLNGSDEFKRRAVEVAVYSGMRVKFNDEKLNEYAFEYADAIKTKVNPERTFPDEALARFRRNIGDGDIPDESIKRVGHKVK